jgi:hypothetical protein
MIQYRQFQSKATLPIIILDIYTLVQKKYVQQELFSEGLDQNNL